MENSHQYEELLVRYLANDVTGEERSFVEQWINASEQNSAYFEEMKKAWQLTGVYDTFKQVNVSDRWARFRETVSAAPVVPLVEDALPSTRISWLSRVAIAASLLVAIGVLALLMYKNQRSEAIVQQTDKKEDSVALLQRHEVNNSGKEKRFTLPDGSLIVLADKSEVTYAEPFTSKRQIALTGKGWFKVAKDTVHPFTVNSGRLATTAIGTEFTVTAFAATDSITVRLYEGKVVVNTNGNTDNNKPAVFLRPGQEYVYDGQKGRVRNFILNDQAAPETLIQEELKRDNPRAVYDNDDNWYNFHNQSLESVLNDLSALHNVTIIYKKKDIQHIDYTGKYNRSDSLETILERIALLNNLKITRKDSAFILSKQ